MRQPAGLKLGILLFFLFVVIVKLVLNRAYAISAHHG